MGLSIEDLATRSGTSSSTILRLAELGILGPDAGKGPYDESLVGRVRVVLQLEQSGIDLEDLGSATNAGRFSLSFVDGLFGTPVAMTELPSTALESELSLSGGFLDDVRIALGSVADEGERVREDDAELLRLLDRFVQIGLDESVAEQVAIRFFYVLADSARRVAEGGREMWSKGVVEPLLARGLTTQEFLEAMSAPGPESQLLVGPMLTLLFHRFIEAEIVQEVMVRLEDALEEAGVRRRRDGGVPAIAFLDLSGYTRMTESAGDEAGADSARTLTDLVRRVSVRHGGRLVKMLGDGAMFYFADPGGAVSCGLGLVEQVPAAGLPRARVGINTGPLIQRDGDYYGSTVNIAARVTDYARPNEVLVTAGVAGTITTDAVDLAPIGPVSLKGVREPVELFSVRRVDE